MANDYPNAPSYGAAVEVINDDAHPVVTRGSAGTATPGNIRRPVTTHGTAVKVNATTLPVRYAVVCAMSTNTGIVVVGSSAVVAAVGLRNSPYLNAGDTIKLGPVDLTNVYVDSTVDGEGVTVYYEA